MSQKVEYRHISGGELRASEEGVFDGYASAFGVVDSAKSMIMPGAFAKTLEERRGQIKLIYNHKTLIGSPVEVREDDHGLFSTNRVNLGTTAGRDVYSLIKEGDITGMSIAFTVTEETRSSEGIREIREATLYELGPVDFPANEAALITDVRSLERALGSMEGRATDFGDTVENESLRRNSWFLVESLHQTLNDIWWSVKSDEDKVTLLDAAILGFHAAYMEWAEAYIERFDGTDEERAVAFGLNALSVETRALLAGREPQDLAATTALTADEIKALLAGDPMCDSQRLPKELRGANATVRTDQTLKLFERLHDKLTPAERRRALAILNPVSPKALEKPLDLTAFRTAVEALKGASNAH